MVSAYTGNVWIAVLAGIVSGVFMALILGVFHIHFQSDLFIAGLAVNLMASGGTVFLLYILTGDKGNSASVKSLSVPNVNIPLIKDIPFIGQILSGFPVFTYLAFLSVILVHIFLYRTRFGTHLRAVGENPEAATSLGLNVKRTRMIALALSGVLASLGGMNLSMAYLQLFQKEMANGRGWIGIAAVHLGAWKPLGVMLASILFGFADAVSNQLGSLNIPSQLVQTIPYITTVVALAVYAIQQKRASIERMKRYQKEHQDTIQAETPKAE
jgi:simple sugar transport system permease protein